MHILYLHQHFVARSGTSGGRSHEFSRLLVNRGHRVTLITGAFEHSGLDVPEGKLFSRTEIDGIDVRIINVPYGQHMSTARRILSFIEFMVLSSWVSMRARDVDVVFATSTPLTIAIPGIVASLWHRRPFVFEVRDLWPAIPIELGILRNPLLKTAARWLERLAYRRARRIVALSPGMKEGVIAAGASEQKVTVIPNSSDVELFRVPPSLGAAYRLEHRELDDRPIVAYAGAFGRVNGLEWAVRLAAAVAEVDRSVAFLLVGKGSEKEQTVRLASDMGLLGRNLFFQEPVPRYELPRVLSAATVVASFVIPDPVLRANCANKFFDAFAAGKPIVINYGGWQAELIEREGAGLVLEHDDLAGSASRLVDALSHQAWLDSAAAASRRLGESVFDRRSLVNDLEGVLVDAVESRRA